MNHTFTPDVCKPSGENDATGTPLKADYEGTVTIRMPTYDEKMGFYEAAGEQLSGDAKKAAVPLLRIVAKSAESHVVSVDVVRVSDGHKFTFEEMKYDSDMHSVITEIATKLIGRFQVGNG